MVTGWKITGFSGGTQGHFVKNVIDYSGTTHDEDEYPPYNFADRYCTDKDKYSVSGRVFSQGAYYDVPEGVTGITIEPYWGAAVYLSDPTYDVAYPEGYGDKNVNAVFVSNMGSRYVGGNTASINDDNQTVYTDYDSAFGQVGSSGTVYDNAIVLVGNYHHYWGQNSPSTTKAFTIMSADLNNDCEPDYSFIVQHGTNRQDISAIRFDFINSPGLGMIQKVETDKAIPKHGIWRPKGWFEVTNTTLIQFTQFEYDGGGKPAGSPLILLGGLYDQFVTSRYYAANSTEYIHLGSNIWMKEFCNGTHTANTNTTRHIPISVTGGEFESFYLTGTFKPSVVSITDNAECYISGGKFGDMAGAGQEQLKGDVTWLIDHADITNFYGGGINDQKPVFGHIYVEINNSQVGLYCGGPKFGNMQDNKKVTTKAKGSTFGNFYGAGYGGTSYFRDMTKDKTGENDWDTWNADYTRKYVSEKGISTGYECEFIPYSGGQSGQPDYVGRFYVLYASLSLAKTKNVESTLEDCHITGSFYGGGKLGSVDGNITSTLKNCTVDENVFGAGFSASVEKVNVVPLGEKMKTNPAYNESVGVFTDGTYPDGVPYTWTHAASVSAGNEFDNTNKYIYTTTNLDDLGTVSGKVTLNILGDQTQITGDVYGGGAEAKSNTNYYKASPTADDLATKTTVNLIGGKIMGDVYGGGLGRLAKAAVGTSGSPGYTPAISAVAADVGNTVVNLNGMTATEYESNTEYSTWGLAQNGENGPWVVADETNTENETTTIVRKGCILAGTNQSLANNHGRIFGCNNLMGTPKGSVTVHIFKTNGFAGHERTKPKDLEDINDSKHSYEVQAVYGGGNLAEYLPTNLTTEKTHVIIDGCGDTSIRQVYGGGNAASTPATQVDVNGTYEIEELFGGGNGKDKISKDNGTSWLNNPGANVGFHEYADDATNAQTVADRATNYGYGTGSANVNIWGGRIHRVYGGSNTKGNVRKIAVTMLEDANTCDFNVGEAYGGGKSAPMDGESQLHMSCIPGLKNAYGGAEEADIQSDVTLTITNGNFDRVFGGNNVSGTISGTITVNIEETGCHLITIGQLYGGGNQAAYTGPLKSGSTTERQGPTVNVKSFSSIGDIYGGGYGKTATVTGDTYVNINVCDGKDFGDSQETEVTNANKHTGDRTISFSENKRTDDGGFETDDDGNRIVEDQVINVFLPPFTTGSIGGINNVYGGGNAAKVVGNTNVNIGTLSEVEIVSLDKVQALDDNNQPLKDNDENPVMVYQTKTVKGANIIGNVYGGGNNAEVTGNTNVTIGKRAAQ